MLLYNLWTCVNSVSSICDSAAADPKENSASPPTHSSLQQQHLLTDTLKQRYTFLIMFPLDMIAVKIKWVSYAFRESVFLYNCLC